MGLPTELISQFVKATKDEPQVKPDTIAYGTVQLTNGKLTLQLDGANTSIPIEDSTIDTKEVNVGNRVMVLIKNHKAVIMGNLTSQSVTVKGIQFDLGRIDNLELDNLDIHKELTAQKSEIGELSADYGEFKELTSDKIEAAEGDIKKLKTDSVTAEQIAAKYATIEGLKATNGDIYNLKTVYASAERMTAAEATIDKLGVTYATIDFSNIGKAAIEHLFATSGLIENIVVGDGTITGNLVGVTIKGDLIDGNTIVADKLVIQGDDGLYYKLNTQGITADTYTDAYVKMGEITAPEVEHSVVEGAFTSDGEQVYSYTTSDGDTVYFAIVEDIYYEVLIETNALKVTQTDHNSLNGSIITAKSITATQISVSDLVAFDATIGGFTITDNSIYSDVKDDDGNTTRGIHLGADGQVTIGDQSNFIKYYQDTDGSYKLVISAASILYALNGKQYSLEDLGHIGEYVHIGTYEDEPCIELGESDSDFKLIITNTRILFMEGSTVPAYINNQSLHITKAVIEEEIQQGEFVWKVRANGNMGLMWKGET